MRSSTAAPAVSGPMAITKIAHAAMLVIKRRTDENRWLMNRMRLSLAGVQTSLVRRTYPALFCHDADIEVPTGYPRAASGDYVKSKLNKPKTGGQSVLVAQQSVRGDIENLTDRRMSETGLEI